MIVGGEEKNIVQILLPGMSPMGQADLLAKGVEKAGSTPVITGFLPDVMKQVEAIKNHRSTILVGYPFYIYRLTQEARQRDRLENLGIRAIVTTGEHVPSAVRDSIQKVWSADLFSHYGLVEMGLSVGMECDAHKGYHIDEADFIVEVVDPHTGRSVEEGGEGELVMTTLSREGMPLIRYRTRDLSRIIDDRCECGSILKRIDLITKRIGTAINVVGSEVYPSDFDDSLFSIPEVVDYQIRMKGEEGKGKIIFTVEVSEKGKAVRSAVEKAIFEHPFIQEKVFKKGVKFGITLVSKGVINREFTFKRSVLAS